MVQNTLQIAIDGPVAAGKGTVAKLLAERLGFLYVDTGAMYRCVALLAMRNNVSPTLETDVALLVAKAEIQLFRPTEIEQDGRLSTVKLNGEDVSWLIRTPEVGRLVPQVAALAQVRKLLVIKQQEIAQSQHVVMEGRDITYRVLPDAQLKIYLTADDNERAKRRHAELLSQGQDVAYKEVLKDLKERDARDMGREVDPLQIVPGAWVFDTTGLSIEDVVDRIEERVQTLRSHP